MGPASKWLPLGLRNTCKLHHGSLETLSEDLQILVCILGLNEGGKIRASLGKFSIEEAMQNGFLFGLLLLSELSCDV